MLLEQYASTSLFLVNLQTYCLMSYVQGGHDANEFVMPAHGVKFLHAAAERHNNLATLLLALCFECGKGVEVSFFIPASIGQIPVLLTQLCSKLYQDGVFVTALIQCR